MDILTVQKLADATLATQFGELPRQCPDVSL